MQFMLAKRDLPKEIISFLTSVFEIYEIRAKVGQSNGVVFQIRTNEKNHNLPHVHASYGEYSISIEIASGAILAGNLPRKNEKVAVEWVLSNKEKLMSDWKSIALSATSVMTRSNLDFSN